MFAVIKMELSGKTVYGPVLKTTQLSTCACAKSRHACPERCRKSFTMIFLGDHDIPLTGSNFGNLIAFRAIFSQLHSTRCMMTNPQPLHPVARGTYRQFGLQGRGIYARIA